MQATATQRSAASAPVGSMLVAPSAQELSLCIREDKVHLGDYPTPCSIELHLPTWDEPPVIAAALLVRLAGRERSTYQHWVNVQSMTGLNVAKCLSEAGRIQVHLVTDRIERSIRTPNVVKRHAAQILKRIAESNESWSEEQFEQIRRQIESLYPTTAQLWRACARGRR